MGVKFSFLGALSLIVVAAPSFAGSFIGIEDIQLHHPNAYQGKKIDVVLNVCVQSFEQAPELLYPTQLAIEAWNISAGTTDNVKAAGIPEGKIDAVRVLIHELGHCAFGLEHPIQDQVIFPGFTRYGQTSGTDSGYNLNSGQDGVAGTLDDERFFYDKVLDTTRYNDPQFLFCTATNNPFQPCPPYDKTSHSANVAFPEFPGDLPPGHLAAANANLETAVLVGEKTQDVMYTSILEQLFPGDSIRRTSWDDWGTSQFIQSGLDLTRGTSDDYTVTLAYQGVPQSEAELEDCNILIRPDTEPSPAPGARSGRCLLTVEDEFPGVPGSLFHARLAKQQIIELNMAQPFYFEPDPVNIFSECFESGTPGLFEAEGYEGDRR